PLRPPTLTLFPYTTLFRSRFPQSFEMLDFQLLVQQEELQAFTDAVVLAEGVDRHPVSPGRQQLAAGQGGQRLLTRPVAAGRPGRDRKSTRLNSSHQIISYA